MRQACRFVPGKKTQSIIMQSDPDRTGTFIDVAVFDDIDQLMSRLAHRIEKFSKHYALVDAFHPQEALSHSKWQNIEIVVPFQKLRGELLFKSGDHLLSKMVKGIDEKPVQFKVPNPDLMRFGKGDPEDWEYLNQIDTLPEYRFTQI